MGTQEHDVDPVLEILDAGSGHEWSVTPGQPAQYPICIRNGTSETHDVDVSVAGPIDWAQLAPSRMMLPPGAEALTQLTLTIQPDAAVAAGKHDITLELLDFEGTCFGQLVGQVNVRARQEVHLSAVTRGPLIRRELIEGFIVHCTLVNRGNCECVVQLQGDGGDYLVMSTPTITVPMGAEVTFDIEGHWTPGPIRAYPTLICIRATHAQGEARAEIAWNDVAECLRPFVPALESEEEFPEVVAWAPRVDEPTPAPDEKAPVEISDSSSPSAEIPPQFTSQRAAPMRVQIRDAQAHHDAGRPSTFRWSPVDPRSGKWRAEVWLLLTAFALTCSLAVVTLRSGSGPAPTPFVRLPTTISGLFSPRKHPGPLPIMSVGRNAHMGKPARRNIAQQHAAVAVLGQSQYHAVMPAPALPTLLYHAQPKGAAWEGTVVHISASNIKVYGLKEHATRSFIVSPGFKSVFSADGTVSYPMSYVQPGAVVRVFYSYVLGFRHPNAIFVINPSPHPRR